MSKLEKELTNFMLKNIDSGTPKTIGETVRYFTEKGYEVKDIHEALKTFSSKHITCNAEEYD